jgi:hypothetical protein
MFETFLESHYIQSLRNGLQSYFSPILQQVFHLGKNASLVLFTLGKFDGWGTAMISYFVRCFSHAGVFGMLKVKVKVKVKLSPSQTVEARRVARCRGSHIA